MVPTSQLNTESQPELKEFRLDPGEAIEKVVAEKLLTEKIELHKRSIRDVRQDKQGGPAPHESVSAIVVNMTNPKGHVRIFDGNLQVTTVEGEKNRGKFVIVVWRPGWRYFYFGEESCEIYHVQKCQPEP
ncbi:hypothetical protein CGGC5_v016077 [Colletotrichum fructicola Nara gc5]|uniref:Uncharacterized protein n=1 Tax=Colletotrichum fructicola (strain Nara gc5) TaxID=1213859 RepID=A0A7J6IFX9_COLFN|nr:hypothetical protein CFRS1_v015897 [Colletotrichum fructicola]KAF4475273.1 hypothetical protein CGGC5_v016077 [Colletotrichum fructicola Nara gc5]